jgi:hypothetical protein
MGFIYDSQGAFRFSRAHTYATLVEGHRGFLVPEFILLRIVNLLDPLVTQVLVVDPKVRHLPREGTTYDQRGAGVFLGAEKFYIFYMKSKLVSINTSYHDGVILKII